MPVPLSNTAAGPLDAAHLEAAGPSELTSHCEAEQVSTAVAARRSDYGSWIRESRIASLYALWDCTRCLAFRPPGR